LKKKTQRFWILFTLLVMGGSGLWLLLDTFEENVVFYLTPTKLLETNPHRTVRLGGLWFKIASNRTPPAA